MAGQSEKTLPQDRRRSPRRAYNAVVHYQMNGSEFVNVATDVSAEGIFIRNFTPPPLGTEIRIRITLPGENGGRVYLIGRVVRVVEDVGSDKRGMGVEFSSLQADSQALVQRLVEELFGAADPADLLQPAADGGFHFLEHPHDTLRLQAGEYQPPPAGVGQYRLVKALLLVLVGMLLGGGLFFLVFLAN